VESREGSPDVRRHNGTKFAASFGGFAVLHAAFLHPERRQHFERELNRVGVEQFTVIETRRVEDSDPRLRHYAGRANGLLSLIDGFLAAIDLAESKDWRSVVILEDDIVFRPAFTRQWSAVEPQVESEDWGVLTLHRTPRSGSLLACDPLFGTRLIPIRHNQLAHCVIVRKAFYQRFRESLLTCIERGYPADFFYGVFSDLYPRHLFATNRNLTGQAPFKSSLQFNFVRRHSRYHVFRSGNPLECLFVNPLHAALRKLRRLSASGGRSS
jgi:hypothetical protein